MTSHKDTLVIDLGSTNIKAGVSTDTKPTFIFPSKCGKLKNVKDSPCFVGYETFSTTGLDIINPIENRFIKNWEHTEKLLQYTLHNQLNVESEGFTILLTEAPLNKKSDREKTLQMVFETTDAHGFCLVNHSVLSMYASGKTTGVNFHSKDGISQAVPIYEGCVYPMSINSIDFAGKILTKNLMESLCEKGYSFKGEQDELIVKDIKEKLCYVALNYDKECQENFETIEKIYQLPDGNVLNIGGQSFVCPEVLFNPNSFGIDSYGVQDVIQRSITLNDIDMRKDFYSNIVLSGGTTSLEGFAKRLEKEMIKLAPDSTKINIINPLKYSEWIGGSMFVTLSTFSKRCISKEDFEEFGPGEVHRK